MKIASVFSLFLIASVSIFSPISISGFINPFSQGASIEEISGYQEWNADRTIDKNIVVKTGATLVIGKGVKIDFAQPSLSLSINGNLYVKGTLNDPVYIGSSLPSGGFFSIQSYAGSNVMMRNATIDNGGSVAYLIGRGMVNKVSAAVYSGSIHVVGGKVDIQNVTFKNNKVAVYVTNASADLRVNRSRFVDNEFDVHAASGDDFRYNWWGDPSGPQETCYGEGAYRSCYYEKMEGAFDYSKPLASESFRDPVVIIPGIMGSVKPFWKDEYILDPILGTYNNLIKTLEKNGYQEDVNLFVFPYEWRKSNVESVKLLKTKIEEIKTKTDWPKVDIVAHSMGGLVAREYIETLDGGKNVDQLVTLGTPHSGSPKAYLTWDGGEFGVRLEDRVLKKIFQQEAEENDFEDVFDYVRNAPIPSVRELLPTYPYLKEKGSGEMRTYPDLYPKNVFLENLGIVANVSKLIPVEIDNVIGKTSNDKTIEKIRVGGPSIELMNDPEEVVLWGHGEPDGYDDLFGDKGLELGPGDGTVPYDSAKGIAADVVIEIESEHSDIPSDAAKTVVKLLKGHDAIPDLLLLPMPKDYLLVMPHSPIDIQIVSPSEKRMGKNFETGGVYDEIPGAYYTGYDTKSEFIIIPNPEDGEYKILTQGTDVGSYRIEVAKIVENEDGSAKESTVSFTGTAVPDAEEETVVVIEGDGVSSGGEKDEIDPITTVSLSGTQGTSGWHTGDVTVTLSATDNDGGSGIDKTEYSLDNGVNWIAYTDPFTISTEGTTTLQYRSIDMAGNQEEAKTETIKIDKTKPIITGTAFPAADANGWNTTDVEVRFVCADSGAGQSDIETDTVVGSTLTSEGKGQSLTNTGECTDKAGNQATPVTVSGINIDKTAPEAKISFDLTTQKLEITGKDDLSDTSVIILEKPELNASNKKVKKIKDWFSRWHDRHKRDLPDMLAAITDESGHTTSLTFEKQENRGNLFVRLLSIGYDEEEADILKNASIGYVWHTDKKDRYMDFSSSVTIGDFRLMSTYLQRQDRTIILEQAKRRLPKLTSKDGMAVPYTESQKGKINIGF